MSTTDAVAAIERPRTVPMHTTAARTVPWTRDTIIAELSRFLGNKTEVDAAFIARHGPRGLVPAARRVFGRFDAALNVAALHWSKQRTEAVAEPKAPT